MLEVGFKKVMCNLAMWGAYHITVMRMGEA